MNRHVLLFFFMIRFFHLGLRKLLGTQRSVLLPDSVSGYSLRGRLFLCVTGCWIRPRWALLTTHWCSYPVTLPIFKPTPHEHNESFPLKAKPCLVNHLLQPKKSPCMHWSKHAVSICRHQMRTRVSHRYWSMAGSGKWLHHPHQVSHVGLPIRIERHF